MGFPRVYRLLTREKVGSARLLLYPALGFAWGGGWAPLPWLVDTVIVFGGILFASILNDYYDHLLLGERNEVGAELDAGHLTRRNVQFLVWLPWIASLVSFIVLAALKATPLALSLLWVSFILSYLYCAPPLRLKARTFWGVVTPPIGIFLLFLQALTLMRCPDTQTWLMGGMVLLFTWYIDFLHLAEDATRENEVVKLSADRAVACARLTAVAGLTGSAVLGLLHPILLVSTAAWTLRLIALRGATSKSIAAARKNIFSHLYLIAEFAIYTCIVMGLRWACPR